MRGTADRSGARAKAWAVHLLTASGGLWGLLALEAIASGRVARALGFMALAVGVDAVDGGLARRFAVRQVLPQIDGGLLDNLVDYLNYVVVPAFLALTLGAFPPALAPVSVAAMVVASAFQFAHAEAKAGGRHFRGFPSYWNVVVLYGLLLELPRPLFAALVLGLAALALTPLRFVYPTRTPEFRRLTLALSTLWAVAVAYCVATFPHSPNGVVFGSLIYVVYYLAISLRLNLRPDEPAPRRSSS